MSSAHAHDTLDADTLISPPLYTLNLSAAQRCVLSWIEDEGGMWEPVEVPAETVADDCGNSMSTVYEALSRLTRLNVIVRNPAGLYRINARYVLRANPKILETVNAALTDPELSPDDRAKGRLKPGIVDARRRRTLKAV